MAKSNMLLVTQIMDRLYEEHGKKWTELPDDHPDVVKIRQLMGIKIGKPPAAHTYQVGIYKNGELIEVLENVDVLAKRLGKRRITVIDYCYGANPRTTDGTVYKFIKERGKYKNGKLSK